MRNQSNTDFYRKRLKPILKRLGNECADRGMSFLSAVEHANDLRGLAYYVSVAASPALKMGVAALTGHGQINVDLLVRSLIEDVVQNGRPHNSEILAQLGIHPDPKQRGEHGPHRLVIPVPPGIDLIETEVDG